MSTSDLVLYDVPRPGIARLTLNRPQARNAQDTGLLYALNDAFDRAAAAPEIAVIILAANGPHFSSGHDMLERGGDVAAVCAAMGERPAVGTWSEFDKPGAEGYMAREMEIYFGFCERWRNIPKPTIAQVHGKCIAGGLMLVWPCDLIVAADDAVFVDNTVRIGTGGVEFFQHVQELGPRKAKELLFTAAEFSAAEAHRLGMVNHVVPRAELAAFTEDLAARIAQHGSFALKLAKSAVNAAVDAQGRMSGMRTAFALHQLAHWHNQAVAGRIVDPRFLQQQFGAKPAEAGDGPPPSPRK